MPLFEGAGPSLASAWFDMLTMTHAHVTLSLSKGAGSKKIQATRGRTFFINCPIVSAQKKSHGPLSMAPVSSVILTLGDGRVPYPYGFRHHQKELPPPIRFIFASTALRL